MSYRRHTCWTQLVDNWLEGGPLWLSIYLVLEWMTARWIDWRLRNCGLRFHPAALPRECNLSDRLTVRVKCGRR